ncbi:DUF2844 domain-containing protein [Ralstonia sp. RL]|uniref:DUF2844 domain-containing protein n=1 Tax=Ralstonia sp. RL TaxID=1839756 RepID=UPI000A672D1E|nr:DUF2844 domain-containing protein [Ralstonia sp. RL]
MKPGIAAGALLAGMLATTMQAHAALGESIDTVQTEKSAMHAKAQAIRGAGSYVVHEIQAPSGTVVREYAAADGKVFAVAWEGPVLPDIRQLLGKYFPRYADTMQGRRPAQRHASLRHPDLVIESHGRMGAFAGQAYLPGSLPPGVTPDVLR